MGSEEGGSLLWAVYAARRNPVEGDVFPAERGDVGNEFIWNELTVRAQFGNGTAEINCIPKDHSGNGEIEPGCAAALVFKGAIADFTVAVKEDGF